MSPFSPVVLLSAALVSSPALWNALAGRQDPAVGLGRFLVAVALCWAAVSALAILVGPPPAAANAGAPDDAGPDTDPGSAPD